MNLNKGTAEIGGSRPPRRPWQGEALLLATAALLVTLVFGFSSLDIAAARWFYRPENVDRWPMATELPWRLLYGAAPFVTAGLVLAGLVALAAGFLARRALWRRYAVFVLLTVVVGPGLLANALFKDHWHHPRPREVVEFGGPRHLVRWPLVGMEGGASFPCGHCTVGFLCGVGWWIWRERRPTWARASLAAGLVLGGLLGAGRMAAGGHFLSDILWSALLAYGVAHLLYFHVLRVPSDEELERARPGMPRRDPRWQRTVTAMTALGAAAVLVALFATPHGTPLSQVVELASFPSTPRVLEVEATTADIEIVLVDDPAATLSITGELHGFGLPTSRLEPHLDFSPDPLPTLRYQIEQHGWFTDLDGLATLRVSAAGLERVVVRVTRGDIRVTDATRSGVVRLGALRLDLHTAAGHVQLPS